ncbi:hypothetical protein FBU30_011059 [Linnemannia zychae]|nr:hypothetical protein FBU30_011059 [Linnemannia zychae]
MANRNNDIRTPSIPIITSEIETYPNSQSNTAIACPPLSYSTSDPLYQEVLEVMAQADAGDATAQCALGDFYRDGNKGVAEDIQLAMFWHRKAADQGDSTGQRKVGYIYDFGLGVPKDEAMAVEWYTKSADQGNPGGQYNLALYCWEGNEGVKMDKEKAIELFHKSAEQGWSCAQYALGLCYGNMNQHANEGLQKDFKKSLDWFIKAAEQTGDPNAQFRIGFLFKSGLDGIEQDFTKAME